MLEFSQDQWISIGLIFLMGVLIGGFLMAGGGRKWKERYKAEKLRREQVEADYKAAETEWREQDSLRAAALKGQGKEDPAV
ncbi:hypothetical protein [Sphingomicrobium sediminis]|uniref:Uncharacterized protein n=1 Tax=Sphingomicrobium sediminis TaxID=2950949 RepID=A0A9X2EGN1_9SPHN|nr:hypothetical protein [Sphingomicrobium sediminis]MCM8557122.1 hypothetical protein [Sphingomicrobium sediminis]